MSRTNSLDSHNGRPEHASDGAANGGNPCVKTDSPAGLAALLRWAIKDRNLFFESRYPVSLSGQTELIGVLAGQAERRRELRVPSAIRLLVQIYLQVSA